MSGQLRQLSVKYWTISAEGWAMNSISGDLATMAGLLALLVFLILSTLWINRTRKARLFKRKLTSRLLNWK
jgi:hypothetical protein